MDLFWWLFAIVLFAVVIVAGFALASRQGVSAQQPAQKTGNLILRGDMTFFYGPGKPRNCNLSNVYKHGDPVGCAAAHP